MASMNPEQENIELLLDDINQRIESLKVEFNLYFSGETRIPPEKERNAVEKKMRNLVYSGKKNARVALLLQNVSSRFSLYNNMWLKRMNEIETGVAPIQKKRVASMVDTPPKPKPQAPGVIVDVSLNSEDSFETLFNNYTQLTAKKEPSSQDKEKMINSIKSKMIGANLIDAKVNLSMVDGKLKIKLKSAFVP
jgi:hypothetical protein